MGATLARLIITTGSPEINHEKINNIFKNKWLPWQLAAAIIINCVPHPNCILLLTPHEDDDDRPPPHPS